MFEAFDTEHQCSVALKLLPSLLPQAVVRFKNEFRSLQGIHHPHLVTLGELIEHEGQLFFTMELVLGVDIIAHAYGIAAMRNELRWAAGADEPTVVGRPRAVGAGARPTVAWASAPDEERLRSTFAQLTRALMSLHANHKVHRDVKPANVLVTDAGRVVLLDFGLVVDLVSERAQDDTRFSGTIAYMSPEQAEGAPVSAASDWYGLGVLLYEALTGRLPFQGPLEAVLAAKQTDDPPRPSSSRWKIPDDLSKLAAALLRRDPKQRPSGREVLSALRPGSDLGKVLEDSDLLSLVGRRAELELLSAALERVEESPALVVVEGESGVGKTALVREFLASARSPDERGLLTFFGRCSEREMVPFKAFDAVVQRIAEYLRHLPPESFDRRNPPSRFGRSILDASRAFPILSPLVPAAALTGDPLGDDPLAQRRLAFRGLRELFEKLALESRIVICIDDWQWADADSVALLSAILAPPLPPPLLLLLVRRPGDRAVDAPCRVEHLRVGNLCASDAENLARRLLTTAGRSGALRASVAPEIAAESTGHPLFIAELVRQVAGGGVAVPAAPCLDDALWSRFRILEPPVRHALELLAVARSPLPLSVWTDAMSLGNYPLPWTEVPALLGRLRQENWARSDGLRKTSLVDCAHDRVATAIVSRLPVGDRRARHQVLGAALERSGCSDFESLTHHW
ncbi:MAG TPA: AAA family ATPase, partial [Polyangiaceae bacterium]